MFRILCDPSSGSIKRASLKLLVMFLCAIGIMRITTERTLEIDEELCVCFIEWQKAFDRVNWTKLMQILKRTGIDWRERRLISKLYMDQRVKI